MTVDWKKKLIPNLPYLLFVYLFDKLCQAVRLAPGLDASEKFLHLSQGFTEAFSSGLPSLHPLDLLAGIAGAVIVRLAVYAKSKNTKKYRKGIEYGSARWGTAADIAPYVNKYIDNPPTAWEIPAEYLTDERFNTLITEAEKYLGYPYVWGGSSPSTSFDCSGFVSYVLTNSGLCNTGRLGAQGLYNISTPVSDPQPGDLVFFVGTYDTTGVSHVGIYVGDGMMLHCGDPIQYSNLNTSYWQSHFYAYGRPPYN